MNVYTCQENPSDTVTVGAVAEGVLVVIRSETAGKGRELELSTSDARDAARAIRNLTEDPERQPNAAYGALFVAEGSEDETVYLSENPLTGAEFSVLLSNEDALTLAKDLDTAAEHWDVLRLGGILAGGAADPTSITLTPDQLGRATAVAVAASALGGKGIRYVTEVAEYILTGVVWA